MKTKSSFRETVEAILIAIVLALFIRAFLVQAFKIPSASMENTLLVGDHILVNKFIYGTSIPFSDKKVFPVREPERGDVVVFVFPGDGETDFIKRIMAMPGERISIRRGKVLINGEALEPRYEGFAKPDAAPAHDFGPIRIPEAGDRIEVRKGRILINDRLLPSCGSVRVVVSCEANLYYSSILPIWEIFDEHRDELEAGFLERLRRSPYSQTPTKILFSPRWRETVQGLYGLPLAKLVTPSKYTTIGQVKENLLRKFLLDNRNLLNYGPIVLEEDTYFVLGDNRNNSKDGRFWGFVTEGTIRGKALIIYWSWNSRWSSGGAPWFRFYRGLRKERLLDTVR